MAKTASKTKEIADKSDKLAHAPSATPDSGVPRQEDRRVMALDLAPGTLSPAMQAFLKPLTATHNITQSFPTERFAMTPEAQERLETAKRNNPPVTHPVVRTHPVSGRRGLFVNDGFTTHINELTPAESRALLPMLYAHCSKPEFVVRWKWRDGDVAFWDNRLTQHYATDDYRPSRRVMNRATIIGDRPI